MSGICGWVGTADPALLDSMLDAIDYRGNATDRVVEPGFALGYRWWRGRPGKSAGVFREGAVSAVCAGTLAPPVASPAQTLAGCLADGDTSALDGAFGAAIFDAADATLTLIRDPFGNRSLYFVEHAGCFFFASELKQLRAIPDLPFELDRAVVHQYLTFSFCPGANTPVAGIRRLLPGHRLSFRRGVVETAPYFELAEGQDEALADRRTAVRSTREAWQRAVSDRLNGESRVGVFLSGGIDSSGVAFMLQRAGVDARCFTLDFGEANVEREEAIVVAGHLGLPLDLVPVEGDDVDSVFDDLVWKLDLPFGDPVTGPQYLLGRAAHAAGHTAVFNGEGGDQLFGGWTNKPMISAEVYAGLYEAESREETYLRSYHRFYGLERQLYSDDFRAAVMTPGARRAMLEPFISGARASSFLNRMRLADTALKGSQNILPRAERMANAWALDVRVPLFDRALATLAFSLPPAMKLHGAAEKYVLKLILQEHLPSRIVWRRKYGMGVPITQWALGALHERLSDLLGPDALRRRGLFRGELIEGLLRGELAPGETRRRRIGERLWTLAMLEAWCRAFIDAPRVPSR